MLSFKPKSLKMLLTCLMAVGIMLPMNMSANAEQNDKSSAPVTTVKATDKTSTVVSVEDISVSADKSGAKSIVVRTSGKAQVTAGVEKDLVVVFVKNAKFAKQLDAKVASLKNDGVRVVKVDATTVKLVVAGSSAVVKDNGSTAVTVAVGPVAKKVVKSVDPNALRIKDMQQSLSEKDNEIARLHKANIQREKDRQAKIAAAKAKAAQKNKGQYKPVTVELVNADLVYVIKYLADKMGRDVFVAPDVAGAVTVTLKGVNPEGALALVLKMQAAEYKYRVVRGSGSHERGTVVVGTPEKIDSISEDILSPKTKSRGVNRGALASDEFQLSAAPAAQVVEFLKAQYPDVKFDMHPTLNGFFAKGTKSELAGIKKSLTSLDRVPEAAAAPTREYIPVNYGTVADVQSLVKTLVPSVQLAVDSRLSMLIVEGSPSDIAQVRDVLENLDKHAEQVMLDVKVVDLNETGTKAIGVTWSDLTSGSQGSFATTFSEVVPSLFYDGTRIAGEGELGSYEVDPDTGEVTYSAGDLAGFNIGTFARSPFAIKAALSFVVSNSDGKILASPRVATLSGEEASIHVGDKYPIVFYDPRAGQFQVNYVDIGTKVTMKPEVKSDGYIVTTISPNVSSLVTLVNNQYPQTAERTVKTKMRIKNGDTVVLGGLVRDEERHSVVKIPLLGDLPIIGALFRQVSDTNERSEVVLMVTAHIME